MAGFSQKLINKMARRARSVKEKQRAHNFDKENKLEKTLRKSPRAFKLSRKEQRRMDSNWGNDIISQKPVLAFPFSVTLDRHDYGVGDYGMRITLASGLESAIGIRVGDIIRVKNGNASAQELAVVSLTDSTHIRLSDLPSYAYQGVKEITQISCVADVAGSLNNTYFDINTALDATKYYVWFNVGGLGVDPAPVGRTGIQVAINTGANQNVVGNAVWGALKSHGFLSSVFGNVVVATNAVAGHATDASDAGATGFTITVLTQGVDPNPTPTAETNIQVLALLSSVKASYK